MPPDPPPTPAPPAAPAAPPPTTPPAPANSAEPKPAAAPAQSPAAGPATAGVPDLDPQTQMEIPKKDGTGFEVGTLQDMADALLEKRAGKLDPKQAEKIAALDKAVADGDPQAAHDLLDLYMPKPATVPDPAADGEPLVALQKEVAELKRLVGAQSPIVEQIEDARIHSGVKGLIGQHVASLPYLAKDADDGARRVTAKIATYRDAAKSHMGLTDEQFNNHPRRQQILARAMLDCEQELKTLAVRFSGFDPAVAGGNAKTAAAGGTIAVEDQTGGAAASPNRIPARFQVDGGRLVDTAGRAVVQTTHGAMETVPAEPLAGEPSGTAVGATPAEQPQGAFSMDQMKANMRKRQQEISSE